MARAGKKATPARKTPQGTITLRDRLKALRLSLVSEFKVEVPMGAMDRVMDLESRHRWRRIEREGDLRDPLTLRTVIFAMKKLAAKLVVDDEDATYRALVAYVKGEGPLPWGEQAPPWREGCSPIVPTGRPVGARVLGTTRVLPPDADLPAEVPTESLLTPPEAPLVATPTAPSPGDPSPAALAVLEQVRAGTILPGDALRALVFLMPCRHGSSRGGHYRE
ncbi:MAG: hypothetical protein KF878_07230 [Planctomycetes bacterium]|nr:hypothetical protein [Planctomycetota bacterium]